MVRNILGCISCSFQIPVFPARPWGLAPRSSAGTSRALLSPGWWPQVCPWWPWLSRARRSAEPSARGEGGKGASSWWEMASGSANSFGKSSGCCCLGLVEEAGGMAQLSLVTRGPLSLGVALTPWRCSDQLLCFPSCPCPSGPHPGALPARLQQQPLVHHVVHAVLAGPAAAAQRHPPVPPAPVPAVPPAAETVQPARYCHPCPLLSPERDSCPGVSLGWGAVPADSLPGFKWDGEKVEKEL